MIERGSFMNLIDPRAQMVVDDYLNSLIVSGDLHLHDLTGFDFCLYENLNGAHFAARCRKKEKYSDVADVEGRAWIAARRRWGGRRLDLAARSLYNVLGRGTGALGRDGP